LNRLVIAGSGIKFLSHLTFEVQSVIQKSDCVLYLVNDPAMKKWINDHSKKAISLDEIYFGFNKRSQAYRSLSREIIKITKDNSNTCFITYGHPMLMSSISLMLINELKEKSDGISVEVLPGISSLDCLLCDLNIDPGTGGIQAYESAEFIDKDYYINSNSHFVLWQIGVVGLDTIISDESILLENKIRYQAIVTIKRKLLVHYPESHLVILYVASMYPTLLYERIEIPLSSLNEVDIPRLASLYVPPYC